MVKTENIIEDIASWIGHNLHKPLRIEEVAARAGYSKWHLQRVFSQVMHISLAQYIRERKLNQAAKDLVETEESIITISCKYGFDSQQSFTRVFSKRYQIPPSRYRNVRRSMLMSWHDG